MRNAARKPHDVERGRRPARLSFYYCSTAMTTINRATYDYRYNIIVALLEICCSVETIDVGGRGSWDRPLPATSPTRGRVGSGVFSVWSDGLLSDSAHGPGDRKDVYRTDFLSCWIQAIYTE